MEYCRNCDELHNEKDCKLYMFNKEKYDSDKVFVDCDLCETPYEMHEINYIHEMNICDCCIVIVHDNMSENDKIEGECPVCLEHKQLNMFNNFQPNSNNILLGDSGYNSNNIRNKL